MTKERAIEDHPLTITMCGLTVLVMFVISSIVCSAEQSQRDATEAQFNAMDTNRDGHLSPDEHAAGAKKVFDTMDADKDGIVTSSEMDEAHEKLTGHKPGTSGLSSEEKIRVVDTNVDGILTAEEHAAGSRRMFQKMDTDKDGVLSRAELATGHANMLRRNP